MYKVFWKLDGDQCLTIVETNEEAEQMCKDLVRDGCYSEVFFENYDEE